VPFNISEPEPDNKNMAEYPANWNPENNLENAECGSARVPTGQFCSPQFSKLSAPNYITFGEDMGQSLTLLKNVLDFRPDVLLPFEMKATRSDWCRKSRPHFAVFTL